MNWKPGVHLVATVGGATKAVQNAIRAVRPERLYFVASGQTAAKIPVILEDLGHPDGSPEQLVVEAFDPTDVYEKTLALLRRLQASSPAALLLDITSGTTAMSVGAAFAAAKADVRVTYVQEMADGEGLLHYLPLPK